MSPDASTLSPEAVAAVQVALADIRAAHGVHIPLAIESGSRAWGFPSPDSDYDARFVFVRTAAAHLTPWPGRDVIKLPIAPSFPPAAGHLPRERGRSDLLDVNGWELDEAIELLRKGDAILIEWSGTSPITYAEHPGFRAGFLDFARRHAAPGRVASQ